MNSTANRFVIAIANADSARNRLANTDWADPDLERRQRAYGERLDELDLAFREMLVRNVARIERAAR